MDWHIREATNDDVKALALIGSTTFLETFAGILDGDAIVAHCQREHSASSYRRFFRSGACAWLAEAQPGGAPVGFALLSHPELPGADRQGWDLELKRIYTFSRFHGAGVGPELMRHTVARAAERGARRLLLGVYAGNARALSFYTRSGFVHIGDRRFRVGEKDYEDKVLAKMLT